MKHGPYCIPPDEVGDPGMCCCNGEWDDPERETYDERRERERREDREPGPGHETYDEKLERWRRGWNDEWSRRDSV